MLGLSMEARMARIEVMMETLMRDRGMTMTPMGSIEREENGSEGFRSDAAFAMPLLDPINPALAHIGQPQTYGNESTSWTQLVATNAGPPVDISPPRFVQLRSRLMPLPYPSLVEADRYLQSFFTDVHLRYPCINESNFRTRTNEMLASESIQASDTFLLALNYILFACCDVLLDVTPVRGDGRPPGWHWCEIVNGLIDKDSLLGEEFDLTLMQLLLFQVRTQYERMCYIY